MQTLLVSSNRGFLVPMSANSCIKSALDSHRNEFSHEYTQGIKLLCIHIVKLNVNRLEAAVFWLKCGGEINFL